MGMWWAIKFNDKIVLEMYKCMMYYEFDNKYNDSWPVSR